MRGIMVALRGILVICLMFSSLSAYGQLQEDQLMLSQVALKISGQEVHYLFPVGFSRRNKKLFLSKFLTSLAVPEKEKVVDLNIGNSDEDVLPVSLMFTDLGKSLLEADLKLKNRVQTLISNILDRDILSLQGRYRVWIKPEKVVIITDGDKVKVGRVRLMVEAENTNNPALERFLEKEILPELYREVNSSPEFADLRDSIGIIALAYWVKSNLGNTSQFQGLIDTKATYGFLLQDFWTVFQYLLNYIKRYRTPQENSEEILFFSGGIYANVEGVIEEKTGNVSDKNTTEEKLDLPRIGSFKTDGGQKMDRYEKVSMEFAKGIIEFATAAHTGSRVDKESLFYKIGFDGDKARLGWAVAVNRSALGPWLEKVSGAVQGKKAVIFVGMGGSINTIKMMKDQFNLEYVIPIDNPDEGLIRSQIQDLTAKGIKLSEIAVVAISKSATTFETHEISKILRKIYEENGLDIYEYISWLIDEENKGKLAEKGWDIRRLSILPIQPDGKTDIGGRFTCPRTALFLLPAYLIGGGSQAVSKLMDYVDIIEQDESFILDWYKKALQVVEDKDHINSRMVIVLPDELASSYETLRIWINQLIQESLGGKADGFDPKTIVMLEAEYKQYEKQLRSKGLIPIDFTHIKDITSDKGAVAQLKMLAYLTLALEYFTAAVAYRYSQLTGEILNFVNQPNVQLYKKKMNQITTIASQEIVGIMNLLGEIEHRLADNPSLDFVEIVYYGPDDKVYQHLKSLAKTYFRPQKIELVFRGPDWNHHAFQATTKAKHTLFVILADERADDNVKKVAQATYEVFKDYNVAYVYKWIGEKFDQDIFGDTLKAMVEIKKLPKDAANKALEELKKDLSKIGAKFKGDSILRVQLGIIEILMNNLTTLHLSFLNQLIQEWKNFIVSASFNLQKVQDFLRTVLYYLHQEIQPSDISIPTKVKTNQSTPQPGGIWVDFDLQHTALKIVDSY